MKILLVLVFTVLYLNCFGLIPFDQLPTWQSSDTENYSTGAAWADINQNGLPDLVIANGNDMQRQHLVVYFNTGEGISPEIGWQSADIDFHGHITVGDVNKNGYPDVIVSVYLGEDGFGSPGRVKLYLNNNGTLSSYPDWISADSMYTFSCALGDANGNGYLDLAVATGEMYTNIVDFNRIYYNMNGIFEDYPGWTAETADISAAVGWGDFNGNGFLDLAFASCGYPNRIYFNEDGVIATSSGWTAADGNEFANSLFIADITNNGFPDLAVSDNNQLGDNGHFKIYLNEKGTLTTLPWWESQFSGYGSGITLADLTGNGYRDLIAGGWWEPVRIHINNEGIFNQFPDWTANITSVVEKIVVIDSSNRGLSDNTAVFTGNGSSRVFYIDDSPLQSILEIAVDGESLETEEYCYDLEFGWISLAGSPAANSLIEVSYIFSDILDIAVSNWGPNESNFIFHNNSVTTISPETSESDFCFKAYPNPAAKNSLTAITFILKSDSFRENGHSLSIYNIKGQRVRELSALCNKEQQLIFSWDMRGELNRDVRRGVYFVKLNFKGEKITKKIVIY